MKKKLWTQIAKLAALTFAAVIVVSGSEAMTVHAFNWDDATTGDGFTWDDVDHDWENDGKTSEEAIEEAKKEQEALQALLSEKYSDVNTLNATVKIKANIFKAKKKAGSYVKQMPKPSKIVVNGKALKYNKKTKEYALGYSFWDEDSQKWYYVNSLTVPGLYRLNIAGRGSYKGAYTKRIYVYDATESSKPMSSVKVKVNKVPYSGEPITSEVIVSAKLGKKTLVEGTDYTVTYLNNVNSGTGIVRLTATKDSGLVGEKEVNFTITGGTKINKAKVTGLTAKTYNYGKAVTQDMSAVQLTLGGKTLVENTDYAVLYYMNNTKVGTAKIVIAGKGKYYGTITKSFKITKVPITAEMVNEKDIEVKYTGKAVKPEVTLKIGTSDVKSSTVELKKGTDYTLAYKNNVKTGNAAQIIVTGKGNYSGKITVTFSIVDNSAKTAVNKAESADKADEETAEEVTEEPVTDEEVTDTTDEPTDTEESENDADTEENPADDETPADEGTENGSDDEDVTAPDETDNAGSDDTDDSTSDEAGNTGSDDSDNSASDDTDSTGSDDADETDNTTGSENEDADSTVTDEASSTDEDYTSNVTSDDTEDTVSDNEDSTLSDDTLTSPETQADVETVIPETSVVEDAETNADAA